MNELPTTSVSFNAFLNLIVQGGPVVAILCCFSVIAATLFTVKMVQYFRAGVLESETKQQNRFNDFFNYLYEGNLAGAKQQVANSDQPIARILNLAISMKEERQSDADTELLKEELVRIAGLNLQTLRSKLRLMEMIASLSPLLGLLGTVIGMIAAFKAMQSAGPNVDPATLSGGIWEALLTTAAGLIVAIPTAAGLSWLERKMERFQQQMESDITRFFTAYLYRSEPNTESIHVVTPSSETTQSGTSPTDAGDTSADKTATA